MQIAVIIDLILGAALLVAVLCGLRRGLFLSLAGLVILVLSVVGAGLAANHFSEPVAAFLSPVLESHIEKRVDSAFDGGVSPQAPEVDRPPAPDEPGEGLSVAEQAKRVLAALGYREDLQEDLSRQVADKVRETSASVAGAIAESLLQSLVHAAVFLAAFVVLTLVLRLAAKALDLVLKLPGLSFVNGLGGAVVGLAEGVLLLFVVLWVLTRFGVRIPEATIDETYLLQFFVTNGPLGFLSSL